MCHLFTCVIHLCVMTTGLPDDHSVLEPPDSIPNSEVKLHSADGSVGVPMRE